MATRASQEWLETQEHGPRASAAPPVRRGIIEATNSVQATASAPALRAKALANRNTRAQGQTDVRQTLCPRPGSASIFNIIRALQFYPVGGDSVKDTILTLIRGTMPAEDFIRDQPLLTLLQLDAVVLLQSMYKDCSSASSERLLRWAILKSKICGETAPNQQDFNVYANTIRWDVREFPIPMRTFESPTGARDTLPLSWAVVADACDQANRLVASWAIKAPIVPIVPGNPSQKLYDPWTLLDRYREGGEWFALVAWFLATTLEPFEAMKDAQERICDADLDPDKIYNSVWFRTALCTLQLFPNTGEKAPAGKQYYRLPRILLPVVPERGMLDTGLERPVLGFIRVTANDVDAAGAIRPVHVSYVFDRAFASRPHDTDPLWNNPAATYVGFDRVSKYISLVLHSKCDRTMEIAAFHKRWWTDLMQNRRLLPQTEGTPERKKEKYRNDLFAAVAWRARQQRTFDGGIAPWLLVDNTSSSEGDAASKCAYVHFGTAEFRRIRKACRAIFTDAGEADTIVSIALCRAHMELWGSVLALRFRNEKFRILTVGFPTEWLLDSAGFFFLDRDCDVEAYTPNSVKFALLQTVGAQALRGTLTPYEWLATSDTSFSYALGDKPQQLMLTRDILIRRWSNLTCVATDLWTNLYFGLDATRVTTSAVNLVLPLGATAFALAGGAGADPEHSAGAGGGWAGTISSWLRTGAATAVQGAATARVAAANIYAAMQTHVAGGAGAVLPPVLQADGAATVDARGDGGGGDAADTRDAGGGGNAADARGDAADTRGDAADTRGDAADTRGDAADTRGDAADTRDAGGTVVPPVPPVLPTNDSATGAAPEYMTPASVITSLRRAIRNNNEAGHEIAVAAFAYAKAASPDETTTAEGLVDAARQKVSAALEASSAARKEAREALGRSVDGVGMYALLNPIVTDLDTSVTRITAAAAAVTEAQARIRLRQEELRAAQDDHNAAAEESARRIAELERAVEEANEQLAAARSTGDVAGTRIAEERVEAATADEQRATSEPVAQQQAHDALLRQQQAHDAAAAANDLHRQIQEATENTTRANTAEQEARASLDTLQTLMAGVRSQLGIENGREIATHIRDMLTAHTNAEGELRTLRLTVATHQGDNAGLQAEVGAARAAAAASQVERASAAAALETTTNQLQETRTLLAAAAGRDAAQGALNAAATQTTERLTAASAAATAQLHAAEARLAARDAELAALATRLTTLQAEHNTDRDNARVTAEGVQADHEADYNALNVRLTAENNRVLDNARVSAEQVHASHEAAYDALNVRLTAATAQLDAARAQADTAEAASASTAAALNTLEQEMQVAPGEGGHEAAASNHPLVASVQRLAARHRDSQQQMAALTRAAGHHAHNLAQAADAANAAASAAAAAEAEAAAARAVSEQLRQRLAQVEQAHGATGAASNDDLLAERNRFAERVEQVQASLDDAHRTLAERVAELQELQQTLAAARREAEAARAAHQAGAGEAAAAHRGGNPRTDAPAQPLEFGAPGAPRVQRSRLPDPTYAPQFRELEFGADLF